MSDSLSNPGFDDRFTCPNCFTDFINHRTKQCPSCGVKVHCYVTTQPVAVCELGEFKEESDDE